MLEKKSLSNLVLYCCPPWYNIPLNIIFLSIWLHYDIITFSFLCLLCKKKSCFFLWLGCFKNHKYQLGEFGAVKFQFPTYFWCFLIDLFRQSALPQTSYVHYQNNLCITINLMSSSCKWTWTARFYLVVHVKNYSLFNFSIGWQNIRWQQTSKERGILNLRKLTLLFTILFTILSSCITQLYNIHNCKWVSLLE